MIIRYGNGYEKIDDKVTLILSFIGGLIMLQATCIQKFRDKHNKIYGYRLRDTTGLIKDVEPEVLKIAIRDKQISITNLILTSDNRLVDKSEEPIKQSRQPKIDVEIMLNKAKLLGLKIEDIPTACGYPCYLFSKNNNEHTIIIPDNITQLNRDMYNSTFTNKVFKLKGHIKLVGGCNVTSTDDLFNDCRMQSLDLSSFDTSSVTSMLRMFYRCAVQSINFTSFNTSNVTDMSYMFFDCGVQSLDLSSFDTSKVTDMRGMFWNCGAQSLDLSSFNTHNVTNMKDMFKDCKSQSFNFSSFDTSNVNYMNSMFSGCKAQSIDLSHFNTSSVIDMGHMFANCKAQSLDLSSFDTSEVREMTWIFFGCEAKVRTNDRKLRRECED